ncbi:MAG: glycosyltransferase family 1 protein, partial [Actinobacteria bacterium]|nr:glycosyltransferase family 1 protein [Actinomycetota bacterium]
SCIEPAVNSVVLDEAVVSTRAGVVVVGEPDDRSAAMVRSLVDRGVDVRMFGAGWSLIPDLEPHSFPRVGYPEMATVLAGAELVLELPIGTPVQSFARLSSWEAPLGQCVLDAAAVATPSLTLERAGVSALMTPGIDIATYATDEDLETLVPLLLADAEGLRAMGENASDTVRSRHLWTQRWEHLLAPFDCPDDDGEAVVVKPAADSSKVAISA